MSFVWVAHDKEFGRTVVKPITGRFFISKIGDDRYANLLFDWRGPEKPPAELGYKFMTYKVDGDQLKLFAAASMVLWPFLEQVKTGYIWLQSGQMDTEDFTQADKPVIFQDFAQRVHRMEMALENDDWPARPSGLCRGWCPVGKKHCEHWEPKT